MPYERIEDIFNKTLIGDDLKNALDFTEFLSANGMIRKEQHEWHYKNERVCYMDASYERHTWTVWTSGDYSNEYEDFPIDERTKEIAWANAGKCGNCDGCDCKPGKTKMIFGKEFTNICDGAADISIVFCNPNAETLECLKKLLKIKKHIIDNHA